MKPAPRHRAGTSRRGLAVALVGALVTCGFGVVLSASLARLDLASFCGPGGKVLVMPDGSRSCAHTDEAPPGVDVTEPVSTSELRSRPGAGAAAQTAAQDLGVPSAVASTGTSPAVTCDGDGTSGYRVQAMYVVESDSANRYGALLGTFRNWASGVDDVINRSAALTGGVRHIRYVTTAGAGGTCVANVANVTVPNGALGSFGATIQALQAQGFTNANRKYMMWTDASSLCGIATLYNSDSIAQTNPNNGSYAQYARIDSGCWGGGDGSYGHSVEAHELMHNLGAVQGSAPHTTQAGHCWDESDTMCYSDGGNHAMVQVCPGEREYLLDCNSDDYFSTYPDPGGYLATHWNAASSRFLVGGGDGSGGGSTGTPTVLGATIAVNNPAVPGLPTQATVTPVLPAGRTLTSVAWQSPRSDCAFGTPTTVQSSVTCSASASGATTVTATITDSSGATRSVTSPLTFATGAARPVTVVLSVSGQRSDEVSSVSMCARASAPVSAILTDTATGLPIKGLAASFTKQVGAQRLPTAAGTGVSDSTGEATANQTPTGPTRYGALTTATAVYAAATVVTLVADVGRCSPTLTTTASDLDVWYRDPVTLTGTLTRELDGDPVGVASTSVPITVTTSTTSAAGRVTTRVAGLGSARTQADGSYSITVMPTLSGRLAATLPTSVSYYGTSADAGQLLVRKPTSTLSATVDQTDVPYGGPVVVTGSMQRIASNGTAPAPRLKVSVKITPNGRNAVTVGTTTTLDDGTFRLAAPLRIAGVLSAVYAGTTALPASSDQIGPVTVGTWATALTETPSLTTVRAGQVVSVTGSLTRSYGGAAQPAASLPVRLYSSAAGAVERVASTSTSTSGTFSFRLTPRVTTTYRVELNGVTGHAAASTGSRTITVG